MAWLIGMAGDVKGRRFELDRDETTIGRAPSCQIPIANSAISSHHCSVIREDRKYSLCDLGDFNGTCLNGATVTRTRLKPKDIIQLGPLELMFDGDDVEVEEQVKSSTAKIEVVSGTFAAPPSFKSASPFGARRDYRRLWTVLVVIVGILAVVILIVFFRGVLE